MSWIVENYIINMYSIKSDFSIDSSEYTDLLMIESVVNKLYNMDIISKMEMNILRERSYGYTFEEISAKYGMTRITASMLFSVVCNKISFIMGGYFTDDGYIDYLRDKYKLNDETVDKVYRFIKTNNRHRMKRSDFLLSGEFNE